MKEQAIVKSVSGDTAKIMVKRQDMCGHCAQQTFCLGCAKNVTAAAFNDVGAHPGDTVTVETSSKWMLLSSALTFILPLLAGITAYAVLSSFASDIAVTFGSLGIFFVFFAAAVILSKFLLGKRLEIHIVQIDHMGPYNMDGTLSDSAVRRT